MSSGTADGADGSSAPDGNNKAIDERFLKIGGVVVATGLALALLKAGKKTKAEPEEEEAVTVSEPPLLEVETSKDLKTKLKEEAAPVQAKAQETTAKAESGFAGFFGQKKKKQEPKTHQINAGDTLWGVSRKYQVSVDDLRSANKLQGDVLIAGESLQLP